MTDDRILEVLDLYNRTLASNYGDASLQLSHLGTMIPKMREMVAVGKREKVFRWLGFMQGVLWANGYFTIDELRAHNMPKDEEFTDHEAHDFHGDPFTGYHDNVPLLCKVCGKGELAHRK
jgi:hypothetical protein